MTETQLALNEVLDSCIEEIKAGRLTVEACLDHYPEFAGELRDPLMAANLLHGAPVVKPAKDFRQQARPRLMAQLAPRPTGSMSPFQALRQKWTQFTLIPHTRRFSMAWMLALILAASVLVGGGTAFAANEAVPGQPLYRLDRSLEEIQSNLTNEPEAFVALQLAFADERLSEAQELADDVESNEFQEAFNGYDESMAAIVQKVGAAEDIDLDILDALLDQALSDHDAKLASLLPLDEDGDPADCDENGDGDLCHDNGTMDDDDKSENRFCVTGEPHPVAVKLSGHYTPTVIMEWFCGSEELPGVGFGQIKHAIQTEELLMMEDESVTANDLLIMKVNGLGWGQIWQQYYLKGKPTVVEDPVEDPMDDPDDVEQPEEGMQPEPPGQAKKADGQEPPGQAKKDNRQEPPGQAKKNDQQEPPGEVEDPDQHEAPGQGKKSGQEQPPGQAKKSDQQQPPGQAKKADQQGGKKNKDK